MVAKSCLFMALVLSAACASDADAGQASAPVAPDSTVPVAGANQAPALTPAKAGSGATPPMAAQGGAGAPAVVPPGAAAAGTVAMAPSAGTPATTGSAGAMNGMPASPGSCCPSGDCLCHGPDPSGLTVEAGPFQTESFTISTGTVHYPTDAEAPFASIAICAGFLNTGPEMAEWGPFYASHGFVLVIVSTTGADQPQQRAVKLLAAVEELKGENSKADSPLSGKLSDRYGTSGYSMGGGGTVIASAGDMMLKTSIGLAPFGGSGGEVKAATLLLCGTSDGTAPCGMSENVYGAIPDMLPKMMISISGATHFSWFGPGDAGMGTSGKYALAFQKVFLDGDERWKPLLTMAPMGGMVTSNIK